MDDLFNKLKETMMEYCSLNGESKIEDEINYHIKTYEKYINRCRVIPRYFVDIRGGCGAVRDKWHESYDEDYPGLHQDTGDVVIYIHGYIKDGHWEMRPEDVEFLNKRCRELNNLN